MESGDCWRNELTLAIRPLSPEGDTMEGSKNLAYAYM